MLCDMLCIPIIYFVMKNRRDLDVALIIKKKQMLRLPNEKVPEI